MLTLILASHASVQASTAPDPCDGSHWEELSLPVLVECVYGPNGSSAGLQVLARHAEVFEALPDGITPAEEAHLALAWAERVAGFERAPLLAAMTGVIVENQSAERIRDLWPLLADDERRGISDRAARLRRSGIPDLTAERASLDYRLDRSWELAPWSSWCVTAFADAALSIEPLLHLPDADRSDALKAWTDARPERAALPWTHTGQQCTAGLGEILQDWHQLRVETNESWRMLALGRADGA